jgi:protein phosphatase
MTEPAYQIGKVSDTGPARERNEDYADYLLPEDEQAMREKGSLFLVADGMGGHKAGQVASREAVDRVMGAYYADPERDVGDCLVRAIKEANQAIYDLAQADPEMAGMGTTVVAAVARDGGRRVTIANVGDSRAYLLRHRRLTQITVDHSWVEAQYQAGLLTREQTQKHPQRNLITRAVGIRPNVEVDIYQTKLRRGDALILCTDGVSGELSDKQMAEIAGTRPPDSAAEELVAEANALGGTDNATALVVRAEPPAGLFGLPPRGAASDWLERYWVRAVSVAILLIVLVLVALLIRHFTLGH